MADELANCVDIFIRGTAKVSAAPNPHASQASAEPEHDTNGGASRKGARARILAAAVHRFARNSYDRTSLRDIAADAGADAAYVHRSFGSKEALFRQALDAASRSEDISDLQARPDLAQTISSLFARKDKRNQANSSLDIMVHSLGSPAATAALKNKIASELIDPLARRFDPPSELRAAMISSILIGVGISSSILQLPAFGQDDGSVEAMLEMIVDAIATHPA